MNLQRRNGLYDWARALACVGFLAPSFVLAAWTCQAAEHRWHDVDAIAQAAERFVTERVSNGPDSVTRARELDRRLRVRACDAALEAFLPPGGSLRASTTVGVRCRSPVAWKLYVPVDTQTKVIVAQLTRALPPKHRLTAADVEWVERIDAAAVPYLQRGVQDPVGRVLRTSGSRGQLLRASMLHPDHVVQSGERVTLTVRRDALAIRVQGKALASGAIGDRIPVRNLSSGNAVEGIVRGAGLIEVLLY